MELNEMDRRSSNVNETTQKWSKVKIGIVVALLVVIVVVIIAVALLMRNSMSKNITADSFPELSEDPDTVEGEHGTSDDESGSGDASTPLTNQDVDWTTATSIHQFHADDIDGNPVNLDKYKGQYLVVINMSSKAEAVGTESDESGNLKKLYRDRREDGLKILAFWCTEFIRGSETKKEFEDYVKDMGVDADLFAQVHVNGDSAHPLWKWLKRSASVTGEIEDDFAKFLLDRKGHFSRYLKPGDSAMSFSTKIRPR